MQAVRVVVRDQLLVVRVPALQQPGADLDVALPEGDLVAAGGHADPVRLGPLRDGPGRQPLELGERPGRHEKVLLTGNGLRHRGGPASPSGTSRSPPCGCDPSTRDTSTPVNRGRPSSCDAARTTWRTASPSAVSDSCVVGSSVLPTGGNSTTGYVCSLKVERAALMVMWSPWSANVTAPGSSRRTMSVESRAGMTQLPSSIPITSPVT